MRNFMVAASSLQVYKIEKHIFSRYDVLKSLI